MLNTSLSCLVAAMLVGFVELTRAASGFAPWLLFAFLATFLVSLVLPRSRRAA
jgi:uncharacterized membrane protein YtjA (UPF0391 family)